MDDLDRQILLVLRVDNTIPHFADVLRSAVGTHDARRFQAETGKLANELHASMNAANEAFLASPDKSVRAVSQITFLYCRRAIDEQFRGLGILAASGDWPTIELRLDDQIRRMSGTFNNLVNQLDGDVAAERALTLEIIRSRERWTYICLISLGILIAVVSAAMGFAVTRSIAEPLRKLETGALALAAEDFDHRVSIVGKNELATVAGAFNAAAARLRNLYDALRQSEAYFRSLIENACDPIFVVSESSTVLYASPATELTLGIRAQDLTGRALTDFLEPANREAFVEMLQGRAKPTIWRGNMELLWRGEGLPAKVLSAVVSDRRDDQTVRGFVINAHDITDRKAAEDRFQELNRHLEDLVSLRTKALDERTQELEEEKLALLAAREVLREQATHDGLTKLWNHSAILDILIREIDRGSQSGQLTAVVLADVDHFKRVNDTYGHLAGDEVLREMARRLAAAIRSDDSLGRYGGEEFLLVLPNWEGRVDAARIEEVRLAVCAEPIRVAGVELNITCSFGYAVGGQDGSDEEQVIRLADESLYRAKDRGRNCIEGLDYEYVPLSLAPA